MYLSFIICSLYAHCSLTFVGYSAKKANNRRVQPDMSTKINKHHPWKWARKSWPQESKERQTEVK